MKEITKGRTLNSKITLISEKERSAISDKILDNIQEGVLVVDQEGNLIKMNDSLLKIFKDLQTNINEIVKKVFNAVIVSFIEAPDFILNNVSPSEVHLSPDMKLKICNSRESPKEKSIYLKAKARTSHVFRPSEFQGLKPRKSRQQTFIGKELISDFDNKNLTATKLNMTSNFSQASSKNQGLNMPVRRAIEILADKAIFVQEREDILELVTQEKNEDNYRIDCDIILEDPAFRENPTNNSAKFKFHLKILTTSFRDELRFIFILKEKKQEIERRNLALQNENKSKTLAFVSHEMRTPLNCIVGMLSVLETFITPELLDKFVVPAITSAKHLLNLLNDLLDAAQIQAGKFKLVFVEFDLKSLLSDALFMINIQAKPKGIELILQWDPNLSPVIRSDPNRIRQIVINLLGNALKFTQKGCIRLATEKNRKNNTLIHIRVIDTGLGIKEENKKKLFTAFGKLDQDENEYLNSQGVGLGLLISNVLAKNLGPNAKTLEETENNLCAGLTVASEYGQGTTFEFIVENKNNTDLMEEGEIEMKVSEMRRKLINEEPYFIHNKVYEMFKDDSIFEKRKKNQLSSIRSCSEKEMPSNSLVIVGTEPMNSSKNSNEQKIEGFSEGTYSHLHLNKNLSKSKEEIGPGKSFFYLNKDFGPNESNSHKMLNEMIFYNTKARKDVMKNLDDVADNEEKIKILKDLNMGKKCECPDFLICDDNHFNISVLTALLEMYNFRVDSAFNGEEALNKVISLYENSNCCKEFKLIFMDIEMPIKNGYEATEAILEYYQQKKLEKPIIVATSGHSESKEQKKMIDYGMSECLVKPILKGALIDLLVQKLFNMQYYPANIYPVGSLKKISDKMKTNA